MRRTIPSQARFGALGDFLRREDGVSAVELALLLPVAFVLSRACRVRRRGARHPAQGDARRAHDHRPRRQVSNTSNSSGAAAQPRAASRRSISRRSTITFRSPRWSSTPTIPPIFRPRSLRSKSRQRARRRRRVVWSEAYNGGTARTVGRRASRFAPTLACAVSSSCPFYLLLGETQYAYTPVGIANVLGTMTISGSIFMIPRSVTSNLDQLGFVTA